MKKSCNNQFVATGEEVVVKQLFENAKKAFPDADFQECELFNGELTTIYFEFNTQGEPEFEAVQKIMNSIPENGLYIRMVSDDTLMQTLAQFIFSKRQWVFESSMRTVNFHKLPEPIIASNVILKPFSYVTDEGERIFMWAVSGFEGPAYKNEEEINIALHANNLQDLTISDDRNDSFADMIKGILKEKNVESIEIHEPYLTTFGKISKVNLCGLQTIGGITLDYNDLDDYENEELYTLLKRQLGKAN